MKLRVYAEAMYGSALWQIVQEDQVNQRYSVLRKNLHKEDALKIAEEMQSKIDSESTSDCNN